MKIQQHDGVVVDAAGSRQGFAKHKRGGEVLSSLLARVNKRTTHRGEDGMSRQGDQPSSFSKGPHILLNIGVG